MLPFKVSPPTTRSTPVPLARSSVPLSVTPLRMLLLLLKATRRPVPVELMVPPVMALPNWLTTLSALMLITPPVLLTLCPPLICSAALLGMGPAPTLIVPVFDVLPPPSVSKKASMFTPPALVREAMDCAELMVTTLPLAMLATSAAPGTDGPGHDQSLAVLQLPVAGFHTQLKAWASCAGQAPRASVAAMASALLRLRSAAVFMVVSPDRSMAVRRGCGNQVGRWVCGCTT